MFSRSVWVAGWLVGCLGEGEDSLVWRLAASHFPLCTLTRPECYQTVCMGWWLTISTPNIGSVGGTKQKATANHLVKQSQSVLGDTFFVSQKIQHYGDGVEAVVAAQSPHSNFAYTPEQCPNNASE